MFRKLLFPVECENLPQDCRNNTGNSDLFDVRVWYQSTEINFENTCFDNTQSKTKKNLFISEPVISGIIFGLGPNFSTFPDGDLIRLFCSL